MRSKENITNILEFRKQQRKQTGLKCRGCDETITSDQIPRVIEMNSNYRTRVKVLTAYSHPTTSCMLKSREELCGEFYERL